MKNSSPLVSICVTLYNQQEYIAATIQSVLRQTYENFELIIVNDSSTDNSDAVVRGFADRRIRYICNENNLGQHGNWTKVIGFAKGKYIKLLCGDDILYPDCIEEQVRVLEDPANSQVVLVTSHKHIVDRNGRVIMTIRFPGKSGRWDGKKVIRKSVRAGTNIIGEPSAGLFRAGLITDRALTFDASLPYVIDLDYWSKMLLFGDLYVVDRVLYGFRVIQTSISALCGFSQLFQFLSFSKELQEKKKYTIHRADRIIGGIIATALVVARRLIFVLYK